MCHVVHLRLGCTSPCRAVFSCEVHVLAGLMRLLAWMFALLWLQAVMCQVP